MIDASRIAFNNAKPHSASFRSRLRSFVLVRRTHTGNRRVVAVVVSTTETKKQVLGTSTSTTPAVSTKAADYSLLQFS